MSNAALKVVPQTGTTDLSTILRDWAVPAPELVGKLPRITCPQCQSKQGQPANCQTHHKAKCADCGNYLTTAHIHLDYVGHAEVTKILLTIDPTWSWEPVAFGSDGGPLVRINGHTAELWIKLTILGVTRLGVGTCQANKAEASKELIGDALRNAAMRFGVALSLWSKEEWEEAPTPPAPAPQGVTTATWTKFVEASRGLDVAEKGDLHELATAAGIASLKRGELAEDDALWLCEQADAIVAKRADS